jgi:polar amino acid transport system substrate-binding protein
MADRPDGRRPGAGRRAVVVVLALLLGLAGCGFGSPAADRPDAPAAQRTPFDQALHDRLPAAVRSAGRIRVATDASYPPASSFAEDGRTIVGFEPDLAAALGRVLGVELAFVRMDFRDTLPALQAGEVDVVMAAMTDTVERQATVDFIDYFSAGTTIIVQRGNPHAILDLRDLCGQVVAAEEATIQVELLDRTQASCGDRPIVVRLSADNDTALLELRTGRAAAVLNDYPPAARLTSDPSTRADFQLASTVQYEPGFYGIAVPKDEVRLRDALRQALSRLLASGEYDAVLQEWGVASGALETAGLNGGT